MTNDNFDICGITAEVIQNATEQVMQSNQSMVSPFPPIKDEWLIYEELEESVRLQKQNNEILRAIEKNTANLKILVDLIHNSKENQDEIIALLSEIQIMAKAKDSEEAASLYKRVMTKIAGAVKDAETIQKLSSYAGTIFTIVQTFFPKDGV